MLRADFGAAARARREVHGATAAAEQAFIFSALARFARPALVNGTAGLVVIRDGRPFSVLGFTIRGAKVVELDILGDPARLRHLDLAVFDD